MNGWKPSLLLLSIAACLMAATPPVSQPGIELLRRAASNYRAAATFWIEGDIRADARAGEKQQSTTATFVVALGEGNRLHDELDHPQAGIIRVSDGKQTWLYMTSTNQYAHKDAADVIDLSKPLTNGGMLPVLVMHLRGLATDVETAKVLSDDTVPFDGKDRRCAVVEVVYKPAVGAAEGTPGAHRTFWLDRERDLVLQQKTETNTKVADGTTIQQSETFRYTKISLNQPIDASIFTFVPPAGAKQVEQFGRSGAEDLSGQPAGDFTLTDLQGKKHRLSDLRGKVVMLDFWATWCGPCRRQMPLVEKLGAEMKDKGLVTFAVNQGESSEGVRRFLEKNNYGTTTLLDQKSEVGRQYKVSGIPTLVIIDREGKIAAHYVGVRNEETLREGLKKAGL
jgi:thiol-disulfide isomerase/thioredoxin